MKKFEGLPIYEISIDGVTGLYAVALVKRPAMQSTWQVFADQEQKIKFAVTDEEQHKVLAVLCRADFPIYRYSDTMGEYYVLFTKKTIEDMTQRMLREGFHESINVEHDDDFFINGVELTQIFIKNSAKGINPAGFEDIEEGSAFCEYKITAPEVWDAIKQGVFTGISLEGYFNLKEIFSSIEKEGPADDIESLLKQKC